MKQSGMICILWHGGTQPLNIKCYHSVMNRVLEPKLVTQTFIKTKPAGFRKGGEKKKSSLTLTRADLGHVPNGKLSS